jgi:hypothetical protein
MARYYFVVPLVENKNVNYSLNVQNFVKIFCGLSHRLDGEGCPRTGQRQ